MSNPSSPQGTPPLTTLADIRRVRAGLPPAIRRTPILRLAREAAEVGKEKLHLKAECLQVTGAYKPRAAFAVVDALPPEARAKGLVLTSSGNFAQAFAYAGARGRLPVVVVMLDTTSPYKINAARDFGAEVVLCGTDALARQPSVERIAAERGMTPVDTWEAPPIVAGHGSIGLEILEDDPDVETVLVPVSSGGGAAGIAAAIKQSRPSVRVIGVQPERANAAYVSLQRGTPTVIDDWETMADGLSAVRPGEYPFRHLQRYLDEIVLVTESEIAEAMRTVLVRAKILAEPAGAVATAAFLAGRVDAGRRTVAVVTGGNVTREVLAGVLRDSSRPPAG